MFDSIGWAEIGVLMLLALFVFGPERLPGLAADAGRGLRNLRKTVKGMAADLKTDLGPEFQDVDLRSLHPKTFVQKHLMADDEDDPSTLDLLRGGGTASRSGPPLQPGERPPWDPDAT